MSFGGKKLKKGVALFSIAACLALTGCADNSQSEFMRSARRYMDEEKPKEAVIEYTKEIQSNSGNAVAYYQRARCYTAMGNLDAALADFNKAVAIDPKFAEAYQQRAAVYFAKFAYRQSWESLKQARDAGARIDLTLLHSLQKESGKTDEDFFGVKKT